MTVVVASCDKDEDLFYPYYKCMEKYWPNHHEIVYLTESVVNPYYKTICKDYPVEVWTKRIRESLEEIEDDIVLFTTDDDFLNDYVNESKLNNLLPLFKSGVDSINLEMSFTRTDKFTMISGLLYRPKGSLVRVSLACGLWSKDKLIKVLSKDTTPWDIETLQDDKDFNYYILNNTKVLSWAYDGVSQRGALVMGKWHRGIKVFFDIEGIDIDLNIRGFCD